MENKNKTDGFRIPKIQSNNEFLLWRIQGLKLLQRAAFCHVLEGEPPVLATNVVEIIDQFKSDYKKARFDLCINLGEEQRHCLFKNFSLEQQLNKCGIN